MSLLFHKNFSDAATGANGFDSVVASNGTVAHSAGAGLNGTSGGITFTRTADSPNLYGTITQDVSSAAFFRTAWWMDASNITIATNDHQTRVYTMEAANGATRANLLLFVKRGGALRFEYYLYNDSGGASGGGITFNGYPQWVEVRVKRSSGVGVDDAESQVYFGGGDYDNLGELVSEITGVVHYTQFTKPLQRVGMRLSNATVSGYLLFDEWTMRDDDEPILFGVSESVISRGMKYVLNRRRRKSYCW